jgi:hypothetical protein
MSSSEGEVRITNKQSRKINPSIFASRIDKNNGFNVVKLKRETARHPNAQRMFKSNIAYSKITARTPEKSGSRHESNNRFRTSQSKEDNREQLS